MSDGFVTPPIHDGMGVFAEPGGGYRIVRNHELGDSQRHPGWERRRRPRHGMGQGRAGLRGRRSSSTTTRTCSSTTSALNGTDSNCSGAETPWGTWLTCEETTAGPGDGWKKPHGYVFEVDPFAGGPVLRKPIKGMGRFVHEAGAVDPETSVVLPHGGQQPRRFYRYVPDEPGKLAKGGVAPGAPGQGQPGYNTVTAQTVGEVLPVDWVTIDDPDPADADDNAPCDPAPGAREGLGAVHERRGLRPGAATASCSIPRTAATTAAGRSGSTRRPTGVGTRNEEGELVLLFESTDKAVLDYPDNMCTSPGGGDRAGRGRRRPTELRPRLLPDNGR